MTNKTTMNKPNNSKTMFPKIRKTLAVTAVVAMTIGFWPNAKADDFVPADVTTGAVTATAGMSSTGATIDLNASSNFATNINTGSSTGAVSVGNASAGAVSITSGAAFTLAGGAASTVSTTAGNVKIQPAGTGTIANVQIGEGGAGSTTPDYFALDVKSTTGDPAGGTEGYMYYNTFDNKFRCFENAAWKDCDTSGGSSTLQGAYGNGATITTAGAVPIAFTLTNGGFNITGAGATSIGNNAGTVAIDSSDWDITTTGAMTGIGAVTMDGLLTGTAGATLSGAAIGLNDNSNFAVTIGNGSSIGAVSIASGSGTQTVQLGDGSTGVKTVSLGSTNTTSTTSINSGSGAVNVNLNNNQPTNINTGSSTGAVTLGNNGGNVVVNSNVWDITGAGVASGLTGLTTTGAVSLGNNTGTVAIDSSDWDISTTGAMTGIGAVTMDGLLTGTLGATLSGATINLNAGSNFATNIGTGGSTGAVSIGGNANTIAVDSSSWDISTAGVASGFTGITSSGTVSFTGGMSASGATVNVNASSNNATNINTGSSTGAVSIGNASAGAVSITSSAAFTLAGGAASTVSTTAGNIKIQPAGTGTIANVQIGEGGAGSTTPDYFALDVKSTTGDPTGGAEGYMYYNTLDNKFRCFENAAWKDCDTTGGTASLQTAYGNGATITTAGGTAINFALANGDFTVNGAGATSLGTGTGNTTVGNATGTTSITGSGWNISTTGAATLASISGLSTPLSVAQGGTGQASALVAGGIMFGSSTTAEGVTAVGSSGQILRSAAAGTPTWSTATYPATAGTAGNMLRSDGTNFVSTAVTTAQSTPANPTGTTSTTGVMMGLAGSITPARSGIVLINISGTVTNSASVSNGASVQIRTGTGTAPANGAALAGTAQGSAVRMLNPSDTRGGTITVPFSANAIVTGLAVGTAVWIDTGVAAITGGTATISNVSISVNEL